MESNNRDQLKKTQNISNKSDLGSNFVAPDGGWGWIVCVAVGIANLCCFPLIQQFGFFFRNHLIDLGLSNSQITTLFNTATACASCIGLLMGALFRRFTSRRIAFMGATFVVVGILLTSIANSFITYLLAFSIIYGSGLGICISAGVITMNTYFKIKRQYATSICWTITGVGFSVMPHLANALVSSYGVHGAVWIFGGIAMHTLVSATIYQPVLWHSKKSPNNTGDIMLSSMNSNHLQAIKESSDPPQAIKEYELKVISDGEKPLLSISQQQMISEPKSTNNSTKVTIEDKNGKDPNVIAEKQSFLKKTVTFLDLDLLKDLRFLNILLGLTTSNFTETNFSILMPFILADINYSMSDIALLTTIMGITDLITTFFTPFLTRKLAYKSKTYYAIGCVGLAIGRILMAYVRTYNNILILSVWIGLWRGFRSVYMHLVVPNHVRLNRLPAATGQQMLFIGIFSLIAGPSVGLMRDSHNYVATLHFLNIGTFWMLITWGLARVFK